MLDESLRSRWRTRVWESTNPETDEPVTYDDCQKTTGVLFEIKGEQYAKLLRMPQAKGNIREDFLNQSGRQLAASGGRPLVWIFAEKAAARYARRLFRRAGKGRGRIGVAHVPWKKP